MKSILVAIVITLTLGSSALASPKRASLEQTKAMNSRAMVVDTDSYDVYVGGRLIGRDPDPAIRARLRSDHYTVRGN